MSDNLEGMRRIRLEGITFTTSHYEISHKIKGALECQQSSDTFVSDAYEIDSSYTLSVGFDLI